MDRRMLICHRLQKETVLSNYQYIADKNPVKKNDGTAQKDDKRGADAVVKQHLVDHVQNSEGNGAGLRDAVEHCCKYPFCRSRLRRLGSPVPQLSQKLPHHLRIGFFMESYASIDPGIFIGTNVF